MFSSECLIQGYIPRPGIELTQLYTPYNITTRRRIYYLIGQVLIIDNKQLCSHTTLIALYILLHYYRTIKSYYLLFNLPCPPYLLLTSRDLYP
jgi:hypothetical protein